MRSLRIAGCLFAICVVTGAQSLPDELSHLKEIEEESEVINAIRRFDLQQRSLISWDRTLLQEYASEGKNDLARSKQDDIQKRVDQIEQVWVYALSQYERNARANNYYGEVLYDLRGLQSDGVRLWHLALSYDPNMSTSHNNLGLHYFHVGGYDQGLRHLGKALELEPKNPDYLFNTAQIYLTYFPQLERRYKMSRPKIYKEAMRMSALARELEPDDYEIVEDYAINFYAGENFDVEVNWSDAAKAWERARLIAPNQHSIFYSLLNAGRTWSRAKEWANAIKRFEEALEVVPDSDVAKRLLEESRAKVAD